MTHAAFISNQYYKVRQVVKKTGCSKSFIYAKINSGEIPAVRPFGNGPLSIPRAWLDEHLADIEREAQEAGAIDVEIDPRSTRKRAA